METLKEILTAHSLPQKSNGSEEEIVRRINRLSQANAYQNERQAIEVLLASLAKDYFKEQFRQRMEKRYPRLSDELFELKHEIYVDEKDIKTSDEQTSVKEVGNIKIPSLALAEYGSSPWRREGKISAKVKDRYGYEKKDSLPYKVEVIVPGLTEKVKQDAGEAMAYAFEVCAGVLRNDAERTYLSRFFKENESPENGLVNLVDPKLFILWKPTEESLRISVDATLVERALSEQRALDMAARARDRDPALLLRFNKDHYVVATWETHDEEPLLHYLAEFTQDVKQEKLKL